MLLKIYIEKFGNIFLLPSKKNCEFKVLDEKNIYKNFDYKTFVEIISRYLFCLNCRQTQWIEIF